MDNVLQTNGVPLTVFGGAVPELAPEDLPEGASPYNQDCDFNPGSVFTRGGRQNQYVLGNSFVDHNCGSAASVPGAFAPNEVPWSNPSNATLNVPGTYTVATVNNTGAGGGGAIGPYLDGLTSIADTNSTLHFSLVANQTDFGFFLAAPYDFRASLPTPSNPPGWATIGSWTGGNMYAAGGISAGGTVNASMNWTYAGGPTFANEAGLMVLLPVVPGQTPVMTLVAAGPSGGIFSGLQFGGGTAVLSANVVAFFAILSGGGPYQTGGLTDNHSNSWQLIRSVSNTAATPDGTVTVGTQVFACVNPVAASDYTFTITGSGTLAGDGISALYQVTNLTVVTPFPVTQILKAFMFNLGLPLTSAILGMQIEISGHQSSNDPSAILQVTPTPASGPAGTTINTQLPPVDGTVVLGIATGNFGLVLTPALLNNPAFTVNIIGSAAVLASFSIYAVRLRIWLASTPANFNWIKTYEQTDGEIDTLALDAAGFLWDEDVDQNPTVFNSIFNSILPNTFAKSVTFADIEYIAFSNLQNGTDCPRQWNGTNLDRISMVGPGAPCSGAVTGGSGGSNTTPIASVTQAAKVQMRRISWGASINAQSDSTPGNTLVISLPGGSTHGGNPPLNMNIGDTVVFTGITNPFPLKGGGSLPYNLNGTYTILSSGTPIIGGGETDTAFTVQAPAVQYGYSNDFGVPPTSNWFYQDTVATIVLQSPLPNVGVGSSITISGTPGGGPPNGYDGTYTVLSAPNAVSMTITNVVLIGGVATYSFLLVPPSVAPIPGELVTTSNVLNGNPNGPPGIFNVQNVAIQSVSGNTFSINLSNPGGDLTPQQPQVSPAAAQVAGNKFTFDPGQIVNSGNPVSGGNIVSAGLVATGQRKVCYSFLTRSGYITQPSPISTFNVTSGAGSITVSGLSTGPPNVVARIVFFTGANGGNFFYIPQEVDITVPGQPIQINTATIVNDNTTTSKTFSFSDGVLLSATAIDIPGNNLFNCIELGSCRGLLTYASRLIAWSEQAKVTNFRNWSFDGGFNPANSEPLGWNPDPTSGAGGSISFGSPVFGWVYQINNTTGGTQAAYGMITQAHGAYQDEFGVPIIQASTLYSVRITALCQPQPQSGGNLVVDLFSAQTGGGTALGSFSIPLASMTTTMQIYTGTLLTKLLQPVPPDLTLRIWAQNIPAGAQILIDRVEPFPTLGPVLSTAFKCSYANNQESFDLVTGVCGPNQNMQPINGAMVLFDLLYALKEKSWFSTFDNGVTEPNKWNWKEVSNKVGTIGIHSYDHGEGWAVTANRQGAFFFEGGEPIKISQEIQPVWDAINWQYGYTIWMRNDPEQRRVTIGIPIATPNQWMPEFPTNVNPTSPNVVLMCNYRELNTGAALAQTGPIRSTFTGRLMSPEPARKWSFWNIACPYSDFISRANNNWPQFYCTGYNDSKIFALQASNLSDDGQAINSFWISYGFVKPEAADAKGLGLFRMEFPYFTVLATGSGVLNTYVYPESPFNLPYALDPTSLPAQSQGDLEIGVNIKGQRFFIRVGTNAVGAAFRCSKMVVPLIPDTWAPIRGYNVITA